ncbi:MAG TPA: hypothetical protein VD907_05845 [Verrucomicrobiae bacterium]|nr:hypothetical protein [Verrucomicrobiae bacterium]
MKKTRLNSLLTPLFLAIALAVSAVTSVIQAQPAAAAQCGPIQTAFDFGCTNVDPNAGDSRNPIFHIIIVAINFMAVGLGIVVLFFIIWGSLMYVTSNGEAAKAQKGISYITNAVLALVLFMAMYAVANFLIPGGIFT